MACVALTSLIATLELEFLQPTPRVSLHDDDEAPIKSFLENLSSLQAFLQQDKSNGDGGGGALRDLEIQIRDFALKAEDDIEIQLNNFLRAKDTEYEEKVSQILHQTTQEAAESAKELLNIINYSRKSNEEVDDDDEANEAQPSKLRKHSAASKSANVESDGSSSSHGFQGAAERAEELLYIINYSRRSKEEVDDDDEANEAQPSKRRKHSAASKPANAESDGSSSSHGFLKPEGTMVGRHHDCTVIKVQLFSSLFESPKLISIVGMVGIGKTTLVRNLYEDPSVASHFDVRAWVTIHQKYNKTRMLSDLLQSITPAEPNVIKKGSTPDELQRQVRKCLRGRKYLIVLDNIMSNQSWTDIRKCVSDDKVGSCILLTTRHINQYTYWNRYVHHMTLLDPKQSWELFRNILSIEEHLAPKFEKIRNHVVEKCDGLPQLIVEVAKRLSKYKYNNIQQEWEEIEKELESLGLLDRNTITINYNPLPHHLKVCFLYFGVFPKRYKILVKMLIRLWIAEGFVKPLKDKDLEDQAYEYLLELIDRSFLLLQNISTDGKIKTCRMHSAMHSFCVVEAQKEGILCAVNTQQHSGLSLSICEFLSLAKFVLT